MDRIPDGIIQEIIKLFHQKYRYAEIVMLIQKKNNYHIPSHKLKKIFKHMNLKRKNITESPLHQLVLAIMMELKDSGSNLRYRAMYNRITNEFGLTVKQKSVMNILRILDPEGVESRRRRRLRRRIYQVPGPNYLWHIDGHDKLKNYGFAIHGCIDGFSKKVIWLEVAGSNKDPRIIGRYFLDKVKKYNFIPSVIRADLGTENVNVRDFQQALRFGHNDEQAGENSFIFGKSTANQRIERFWSHLRRHALDFFINLFKNMQQLNYLNIKNLFHIEVLRYSFGPVIKHYLRKSKNEWNQHRIRGQGFREIAGGIPNLWYYCPERFNGVECNKDVNQEHVNILLNEYTSEPYLVEEDFKHYLDDLFENGVPVTSEEAYHLYLRIIDIYNQALNDTI